MSSMCACVYVCVMLPSASFMRQLMRARSSSSCNSKHQSVILCATAIYFVQHQIQVSRSLFYTIKQTHTRTHTSSNNMNTRVSNTLPLSICLCICACIHVCVHKWTYIYVLMSMYVYIYWHVQWDARSTFIRRHTHVHVHVHVHAQTSTLSFSCVKDSSFGLRGRISACGLRGRISAYTGGLSATCTGSCQLPAVLGRLLPVAPWSGYPEAAWSR
jgi:hypothetical protein